VSRRPDQEGFTLPELLVAITILGIIMVAIGAMITTAFRTTTTVQDQLSASRGPKMTSRYWVPDVESADTINEGSARCGGGETHVATMTWKVEPSTIGQDDVTAPEGSDRTVSWWTTTRGRRTQLTREACDGASTAPTETEVVVADLTEVAVDHGAPRLWTLQLTVPDGSQPHDRFAFEVTARQQVTP
jgi:prepilin-type N-terminal cleavage/methylation domain-containing protein